MVWREKEESRIRAVEMDNHGLVGCKENRILNVKEGCVMVSKDRGE